MRGTILAAAVAAGLGFGLPSTVGAAPMNADGVATAAEQVGSVENVHYYGRRGYWRGYGHYGYRPYRHYGYRPYYRPYGYYYAPRYYSYRYW